MRKVSTKFEEELENCLSYLILEYKHCDGFMEHTNPTLQTNILKKAHLAGILQLFKGYSTQELLLNLDNVALCQSILEFGSSLEDK